MHNIRRFFIILLSVLFLLTACGQQADNHHKNSDVLQVVTSFTLIEDMVKQMGGDLVEVHNLVPVGTDPHLYEPLPKDVKAATDADIIFYNGFNLEGGDENGWIVKLADAIDKDFDEFYELMEGAEPLYLSGGDEQEDEINPHTFLDPVLGIHMAENVLKALIENLPDHEEELVDRAEEYIADLKEIDQEYQDKIAEIPEENRVLVTSERAYQYMAKRYGLEEGYVFQIDTEEQGTPEQIRSLVQFVNEKQPPVLFVESNVDPRAMETVSEETGVEIFAEIFSDEIGKPGEEGDTYVKFLKYNIDVIHEGLTK